MKKILGSILAITSLAGVTAFANFGLNALDENMKNTLDNLTFESEDVVSEGYLLGENKLVVIVEYTNTNDIKILSEDNEESPRHITQNMENIVSKGLCSQKNIAALINDENYKVEVEYLLSSGERYMVREFSECK